MTKINFQITDILSDDIPDDQNKNKFIITLYGINTQNERIVCHVTKFLPYFFIKIPNDWDQLTGVKLIKDICDIKPGTDTQGTTFDFIKSIQLQISKDFYGLHWNHKSKNIQFYNYLKISMITHNSMKNLITKIKNHYNIDENKISPKSKLRLQQWKNIDTSSNCNLYESNIHPIIKHCFKE